MVKRLPAMQETCVQSLGREDPLEKGMTTHSSILAWRIPWTEETCGLESMGSQSDLTEPLNNNKAGKNLSFQEILLINSLLAPFLLFTFASLPLLGTICLFAYVFRSWVHSIFVV